MSIELSVHDVMCDGSHFSADSQHGHIEGSGSFKLGNGEDGGTISGMVNSGPEPFVDRTIYIKVDGNDGRCCIL